MQFRRLVAAVTILVSCIAIEKNPTAQADTTAPTYVSSMTGTGDHVNGQIAHLIEQAGPGDRIQIALYIGRMYQGDPHQLPPYDTDDDAPPAVWLAIKNALDNGAKVEIITEGRLLDDALNTPLNASKSRKYARQTRAFFVELERAGADVTYCNYGCIRSNRPDDEIEDNLFAINHHKFFLLDYANPTDHKGWKRIVVQSSANVHSWGADAYEQAIAFDADFYGDVWQQYSDRFAAMKTNWRDGDDSLGMAAPTKWRQVTAFIGPYSKAQQDAKQDEYLAALKRVKSGKNCRISIVMGHWTNSHRSKRIVQRLNELTKMGCSVDAIVGNQKHLKTWSATAAFEVEYTDDVHAKFMLLHYYDANRARRGKNPWRKLTYAGSHNFTNGSYAYDDDAFLRIDQPQIYDDFCVYFDQIEDLQEDNPDNELRCVDFSAVSPTP